MRAFAILFARALGDFAIQAFTAASVARSTQHELRLCYRNDRPDYKPDLIEYLDGCEMAFDIGPSQEIPIDLFDGVQAGRTWQPPPHIRSEQIEFSDLVMTPWMLRPHIHANLSHLSSLTHPDPKTFGDWHVVLHWREGTYANRPPNQLRDQDAAKFQVVADHLRGLGATVVQIGHPDLTRLSGAVDLRSASFANQCAAIAGARFYIGGPTGPVSIASMFGTPTLYVDGVDWWGVYHAQDAILPILVSRDDEPVPLTEFGKGAAELIQQPGVTFKHRTAEEIINSLPTFIEGIGAEDPPLPLIWPFGPPSIERARARVL